VDELLRRRPGLGSLAGEARALQDRLAGERGSSAPGASSLTAAELRLLPMLSTHLSFAEIAAEIFLSRHTLVRRRCRSTGNWGPAHGARPSRGPASWDCWRDDAPLFMRSAGMTPAYGVQMG
jgi:hypothetical protein